MASKYLTSNPTSTLDKILEALDADKVLIVTDRNVEKIVIPKLSKSMIVSNSPRLAMIPGEEGKNLETVTRIWDKLEDIKATRRSVVVNIGGGVVTDIGGFAAATFKRGLKTVNFPTTLLGAVDAATGGKTGFNYNGLKNEIGAFHLPSGVIISTLPFFSLSREEFDSGYAEMVKTAMISDFNFYVKLLDKEAVSDNVALLGEYVEKCVMFKDDVVSRDPEEKNLRKILNFGHTAGHAFESLWIESGRHVTHGKAVAHGILVALILSNLKLGFKSIEINHYVNFLKTYYGSAMINCEDIEGIKLKMSSDKKNRRYGELAFTLLREIGVPEINCLPSQKEITEALELYIDFMG